MPSEPPDAPSAANTAGTPAFPRRLLRIPGRTFHRSADILPPLHAADETSSEHGATATRGPFGSIRLARQEAFVCVAVKGASDLV
jgi:hypothetical protein